jgi:hypothetical protein
MPPQELRLFDTSDGGATLLDSDVHPFAVGDTYELFLERDFEDVDCDVSNPDASIIGSSVFAPANAELGLRVRSAAASYRWVMIIKAN